MQGSTRKVCQLIGDTDYETRSATKSRTESRFRVGYTDLGYPVQQGNRTWFFFGDITPEDDVDPVGFMDEAPTAANGECPELRFLAEGGSAAAQSVRLDGRVRGGFNVPTGLVFDSIGKRFIGHFMRSRDVDTYDAEPERDPRSGHPASPIGVFATAPEADPRNFTTIAGAPVDPMRFLLVAPAIAEANLVPEVDQGLPPPAPTATDTRILLVWGTGWPYRGTGVSLAAVRLEHLEDASKWRFFTGDRAPNTPTFLWSEKSSEAVEVLDQDCVGELSVTFDPALKQWRMTYSCTSNFFSAREIDRTSGGGFGDVSDPTYRATIRGVVAMRTAPNPEGPWSDARTLLLPKRDGFPSWGDDAFGRFIHRGNQRVYRPSLTSSSLVPILGDDIGFYPDDPPELPYRCADPNLLPGYCTGALIQDVDDPFVGCCTRTDRCCDFAFDQIGYTGTAPHFSWGDGSFYAPYLIQGFTRELGTRTHPRFPAGQRLFYTLSTLNPYVVDLMSTDIAHGDLDHDGVPNEDDNCKLTWNPGQENCNLDAELAWNARPGVTPVAPLGDACDPVPCPATLMERQRVSTVTGTCGKDPYRASVCIGRVIRDVLDIAPVGPGIEESLLDHPVTKPREPIQGGTVRTHARFCQSNRDAGFNCENPLRLSDRHLDSFPSAHDELPDPERLWHRVTLRRKQCRTLGGDFVCFSTSFSAGTGERGDSFPFDYGEERAKLTWAYDEDYAFWTASPRRIPPIPDDPPDHFLSRCSDTRTYGEGTCIKGRMWTHGATTLGESDQQQISPGGTIVGFHGDELTNNYVHVTPDQWFASAYGGLRARVFFLIDFTWPDPWPVWRESAGASLPIILENGRLVAVHDDGQHDDADFIATDRLRARLADASTRWLSPIEASPFAGGRNAPLWIGLASDGTEVHTLASRLEDGTLDVASEGAFCDIRFDSCPLRLASSGPPTRPTPRTGFAAVYARAERKVLVVGGHDETGKPLDDIWTLSLDDNTWARLSVTGLGEVVSAVYSWRDGRVWVVAYDPSRRRMRLLRIESSTGRATVMASVPSPGAPKYETRGLFLDMDGNIGIYASSERAQKHRIAVLRERAGGYDVAMTHRRDRALSARPIIDLRGAALYYEPDRPPVDRSKDPEDDPVPSDRTRAAARLRSLPLRPASFNQLAELLR